MLNIAIAGAAGRMGRALIEACSQTKESRLSVALERPGSAAIGADAGELAGLGKLGFAITDDLTAQLDRFDVLIDFTRPEATLAYLEICRHGGKRMVIGTSGFDATGRNQIAAAANQIAVVFAP